MNNKIENELRRKLSCAEAELMRQTGCTPDDVAGIYAQPIPKPVVNVRMGESHRLRLQAEDEAEKWRRGLQEELCLNAPFRRRIRILTEAGKRILEYGDIFRYKFNEGSPYEQLKAAIADAESKATMENAEDLTLRNDITGALIAGGHWHGASNEQIGDTIIHLCKAANECEGLRAEVADALAKLRAKLYPQLFWHDGSYQTAMKAFDATITALGLGAKEKSDEQ